MSGSAPHNIIRGTSAPLGTELSHNERNQTMSFDQAKIWQALEVRLAITENPRNRQMLQTVIEHSKAEAARDLGQMMAALVDNPQMHNWFNGRDHGPKGLEAVTKYYRNFCTNGAAVFESPKDRVVVDDHNRLFANEGVVGV